MSDFNPSPRNGGFVFTIQGNKQNKTYEVIVSEEFLSDELSDGRSAEESLKWMQENEHQLTDAGHKIVDGGFIQAPFDRVVVKEVK
ncbi:MAG: hypothetical protein ACI8R4_002379 [Paracoccaceae bacterium]|jgi:hypothetical protein